MRNLKLFVIGFLLLAYARVVLSEESKPIRRQTLCRHGEVDYFSCKLEISRRIISVCASGNTSPDQGYVQYRVWHQGVINYNYPKQLLPPRGRFFVIDVARLPTGLGSHLKFSDENYNYVISTAMVPGAVRIVKDKKIIFDDFCVGGDYRGFGRAVRAGVEYSARDAVDDVKSESK